MRKVIIQCADAIHKSDAHNVVTKQSLKECVSADASLDAPTKQTCNAALGVSFPAGAEDGPSPLSSEGISCASSPALIASVVADVGALAALHVPASVVASLLLCNADSLPLLGLGCQAEKPVLLPVNRIAGVTRAMSAPGSKKGGSLIAGQGAIISLAGTLAEGGNWVIKPRAAMFAALGEHGRELAGSRPAAFAALREAFEEARSGGLRLGDGLSGAAQLSPLDLAALKLVLNREMPLVLSVERASDILAALKLADDYGLQLIISGGAEAHLVAAELASRSVPVLLDPSRKLPAHFETLHVRRDAPSLLAKAGVKFAFIDASEFGSHNARNLRQLAGIAAASGISQDAALAAITLQAAEILGIANVLGSIEPGKIADLVLWDGDPLEVTSAPSAVWIEGRAMPMVSRQTLLRDRYLKKP